MAALGRRFPQRRLTSLLVVAFYSSLASSIATPAQSRTAAYDERISGHLEVSYTPPEPEDRAVVLLVVDGVRWQEIFQGADPEQARPRRYDVSALTKPEKLFPNLYRLIDTRGLVLGSPRSGEPFTASGPNFISLPGYLEIFTGRSHVPCNANRCRSLPSRTVVDDVREYGDATTEEVAVIASWPNIESAAAARPGAIALSTGRGHVRNRGAFQDDALLRRALEKGEDAAAWPGDGDYRPDAYTAPLALRYLETKRPKFLFIGLGDADEFAHRNDYRGYIGALQGFDAFVGDLVATLDRMGDRGRNTTVLITTDHGRAYNFRDHGSEWPESANVWLVALGGSVPVRGLAPARAPRHLSDLASTVRVILGLPQEEVEDAGRPIEELWEPAL